MLYLIIILICFKKALKMKTLNVQFNTTCYNVAQKITLVTSI